MRFRVRIIAFPALARQPGAILMASALERARIVLAAVTGSGQSEPVLGRLRQTSPIAVAKALR
ncbi:hypothetical protein GCM10011345_12480 [Gemmobacter megaterium]|nr:hypothetical protein GCM10011345_12480 [Gemmobacter megaterium]